jgi:hypothetical protein
MAWLALAIVCQDREVLATNFRRGSRIRLRVFEPG